MLPSSSVIHLQPVFWSDYWNCIV